jgi:hypothetical protein
MLNNPKINGIMNKASLKQILLTVLIILATVSNSSALAVQDTKISPYMLFTYLKDTDSKKILQVKMTNITQTGEKPLPGLRIGFYNNENLLGEVITDASGNAAHIISDTTTLLTADDGSWLFTAVFDGDSIADATTGELSILDVDIEMKLTEEEGERIVTLSATAPSADGPVPVKGEEIGVYVPRMFSLLPVSTGLLDENGVFRARFPENIPGDSLGNLTVIGRFNENYFYGSVEKREVAAWGTKAEKSSPVYRSLWSTLAPKWMVVTLAIMLLGVWGHYTLVVINLVRIRKESLKRKE